MKLERIKLKKFKSFKDVEMKDIPNFCVIVGANNVNSTVSQLGENRGFQEVCSRTQQVQLKLRSNSEKVSTIKVL